MIDVRRLLTLAAAINVLLTASVASAQTVIVRNAAPETPVEVAVNEKTVGSIKANSGGFAILTANLSENVKKSEIDAQIFVDTCDTVRRVHIVERGASPAPQESGCSRRDMGGIFLVRQTSSLVIDVAGPIPTLMLRQGKVNLNPRREWNSSPTGLVLFGGGEFASFRDVKLHFCGNATSCDGGGYQFGYTAGVDYWVTPFLAAEGSYIKPGDVDVTGNGANFHFNSGLKTHIFTVSGKVGIPAGPIRFYGQVGANFIKADSTTTNTIDDSKVTIDGVEVTVPGGTQASGVKTEGWGWQFGMGGEVWFSRRIGAYGEYNRFVLKGSPVDNVEGDFDDRLNLFAFGVRVHIGR